MEEEDKKKKLNDDVVMFMRKRSETEAPRYTARLKTYVDIQQKHRRAAAARSHSDHTYKKHSSGSRKKADNELNQVTDNAGEAAGNDNELMDKSAWLKDLHRGRFGKDNLMKGLEKKKRNKPETLDERGRMGGEKGGINRGERSISRSRSGAPSDRCGRRRRRRSRCRRRRRSCRRRRRRRSCRRRRRRRSCRRRRRRSCRRRRRRSRRRRRRC